MIRAAGLMAFLALTASACAPRPGPAPDTAAAARFEAVCIERFTYGEPACACLAATAAGRFDATAYDILIASMEGEPVRERMRAAGLNSSVQGAISRFVAESARACQPET